MQKRVILKSGKLQVVLCLMGQIHGWLKKRQDGDEFRANIYFEIACIYTNTNENPGSPCKII